jgi:hypothetical protein
LLVVVVVVLSLERVVPESDFVTLPLTEVDEVDVSLADGGVGAWTTVVEDEEGGVGAGVTTVVFFSTVAGGVAVVVVVRLSQAASAEAPTMRAMAAASFVFMAIAPVDCRIWN